MLGIALPALGQQDSSEKLIPKFLKRFKHYYDTSYIHKFDRQTLSVAPLFSVPSFIITLRPKDNLGTPKYNLYRPHLRDAIGLSASFRAISATVRIKGRITPEQQERFGETKYTLLRLHLNAAPFIFDFYYNSFAGIADRNARSYSNRLSAENPYLKRPDLRANYAKLRAQYFLSHQKFTHRATYNQTERQKKSKASAFISVHAYRFHTRGDSSFFNAGQENLFGSLQNLKDLKVHSIGLGPGFATTFVKKKWYFSFSLQILADAQYNTLYGNTDELLSRGWRGALIGDASISTGYVGDKYYASFEMFGDQNLISLPDVVATTTFFTAEVTVGMRFKAPDFLGKIYDKTPLKYF